jgi:two-component system, NarL family, invasion response regulator UvrY
MTSVLVVDDHPVVLQGCRRILEDGGITTIFEASDAAMGYEFFRSHRPDVVIVDLALRGDGLGGVSLIRRINAEDRRVPILVLSMHNDPAIVLQALEAGAIGYVLKDTATEELLNAIREVQSGHRYLSHNLAIEVAVSRAPSRSHSLPDLTPRELDTLTLLAKGKSYGHIAQELDVSYKTVLNISWQLKKSSVSTICPHWCKKRCYCCGKTMMVRGMNCNRETLCQNLPGSFGSNIHLRSRVEGATIFGRLGPCVDAGVWDLKCNRVGAA